jgi:hypothetical protein
MTFFIKLDIEQYFVLSIITTIVLGSMVAEAILMFVSSLRSAYVSFSITILLYFMFSGLFVKSQSLPYWLRPITNLSPIRWTLEGNFISTYEYNTTVFPTVGSTSTYELFLELFSWQNTSRWYCFTILVANLVGYKILSLFTASISSIAQKGGRKFRKEENISRSLNKTY